MRLRAQQRAACGRLISDVDVQTLRASYRTMSYGLQEGTVGKLNPTYVMLFLELSNLLQKKGIFNMQLKFFVYFLV